MSGAVVRAVRVRPGDGRLCRTPDGVVFAPEVADGWDEVVAAAMATVEGDLVTTVAGVLSRRELAAPAVVVIAWRPRLAVLVFGDVELRSDHPAVPLLSGRGSHTWVEHSLPGGVEEFQLSVQPPEAGDDTDLQGGVVPAGGLCVELSAPAGAAVAPGERTAAWPGVPPVAPPVAPPGGPPAEPPGTPPPSPPRATPPVEPVPRSPIGRLVFDDGVEVVLEADLVLGRRPPDDGRATYVVDGDRVSRHHAELRVVGREVHLYDPGSRNGTYVVAPGGTEPSRIEVDVLTPLTFGSRVYLGTRSFTLRGPSETP